MKNIFLILLFLVLQIIAIFAETNNKPNVDIFEKIYISKFTINDKFGEIVVSYSIRERCWSAIIKGIAEINLSEDETFVLVFSVFEKIPEDIKNKRFIIYFSFGDKLGNNLTKHFGKNMKPKSTIQGINVSKVLNDYFIKNEIYQKWSANDSLWHVKATNDEAIVRRGDTNDDVTVFRALIGIEFCK